MLISLRELVTCFKLLPLVYAGTGLAMLLIAPFAFSQQIQGVQKELPPTIKQSPPEVLPLFVMLGLGLGTQVIPWLYYRRYRTLKSTNPGSPFLHESLSLDGGFLLAAITYFGTALGVVCLPLIF